MTKFDVSPFDDTKDAKMYYRIGDIYPLKPAKQVMEEQQKILDEIQKLIEKV